MSEMFKDRVEAGKKLAELLRTFMGSACRIYALPRGGLPVAHEVSKTLDIPLDILIVKKLGAPYQEELALGAVTEGDPPSFYFNRSLMSQAGWGENELQPLITKKLKEIGELKVFYRHGENILIDPDITAIIVDDGMATGATVKAAVNFFRDRGYLRVIVAVPVAHNRVIKEVEEIADSVICVEPVEYMYAVGEFYRDFSEISHEYARDLLLDGKKSLSDST